MRPAESFAEQPIRSLQTMLRVLSEYDSALPTVIPDGIYGPTTMHAVTAFQRQNGLPVTGIVDQRTWDAIVRVYEVAIIQIGKAQPIEIIMDPGQVFRSGSTSPYIYLLQSMLTQLSNDHPAISAPSHSGMMDESTVQSLTDFQKLAGLPENGELDKVVWKHLVHQFTLNAHHNAAHRRLTR
ncbi:MAG: peptidoglycan-binding protein [Oscillospiraceae bacterium]|nr:peptidoglycan-binding protein [Oscillospiraceae bacterium]